MNPTTLLFSSDQVGQALVEYATNHSLTDFAIGTEVTISVKFVANGGVEMMIGPRGWHCPPTSDVGPR